jgi:hypothetical protein
VAITDGHCRGERDAYVVDVARIFRGNKLTLV